MVSLAMIGMQELLIILAIVIFLFGARKIPDSPRRLARWSSSGRLC